MLLGKKILVCGASGLLGFRLVLALIKSRALVVAADVDVKKIRDLVVANKLSSDLVELVHLDITCEGSVREFFSCRSDLCGAVNATYPRNKFYGQSFFDVSLDSFNENLSLHLGSSFLFIKECAKYFIDNQEVFSLVNISSVYGVIPPKFDIYKNTTMTMPVEYAAIKSALIHLSKYTVAYVNDSNFRVNCVSPGGIFDSQPESFLDAYKKQTFGAGMLDVDDVLGAIIFLLSDQSKFITAQNIIVDDGFSL